MDNFEFDLEEKFRIACKFNSDMSEKAINLSYSDKLRLSALMKQARFGKYSSEYCPDTGFLDVIGKDRRRAWEELGEMDKDAAKKAFIEVIDYNSAAWKPYLEAQRMHEVEKIEKEQKEKQKADELARNEDLILQHQRQFQYIQENDYLVRTALNQQTYPQFLQYAQEQHPNNKNEQDALIAYLQEQHFRQYIQQIHQQYLEKQNELNSFVNNPSSSMIGYDNDEPNTVVAPSIVISHQSDVITQASSSPSAYIPNTKSVFTSSAIPESTTTLSNSISHTTKRDLPVSNEMDSNDATVNGEEIIDNNTKLESNERKHSKEMAIPLDSSEPNVDTLPPIAAASMWTRKDVTEFITALKQEKEASLRIGSGETITVRVPTHEEGSCIFWEFCTEGYDIGFGVYFEWMVPETMDITYHINESSSEDDESPDKTKNPTKAVDKLSTRKIKKIHRQYSSSEAKHEEGSHRSEGNESSGKNDMNQENNNDNDDPSQQSNDLRATETVMTGSFSSDKTTTKVAVDEILPIYRRDSHLEVHCGSHIYPGQGVYLFKFDNSYSVLRSKTLYYRVYYTK